MTTMTAGSNLEKILKSGKKAVTCECGPPRGADAEHFRHKAAYLKNCADAVNVTDNQTAVVRFCSMAASKILLEMGIEPVMQMVTRDMNRIGLQSNVLGGAALGIKNLIIITGDPPKVGDYPDATVLYLPERFEALESVADVGRAALERLGGWAEWCICEDAELGLRLLANGYQSVYVNHVFGRGLTAQSFAGYKGQRYRWAYGAVQIVKRYWRELMPWAKGTLSSGQRYHFLTGWAPWFADGLQLLFTVAAMYWTVGLLASPKHFVTPYMLLGRTGVVSSIGFFFAFMMFGSDA